MLYDYSHLPRTIGSLQELAPFKSLNDLMVAGYQRACPSTALDKKFITI